MPDNFSTQREPFLVAFDKQGNIVKIGTFNDLQVGTDANRHNLTVVGGLSLDGFVNETTTRRSSNPLFMGLCYSLTNNDMIFLRDQSSTVAVSVELPSKPTVGEVHVVKDALGVAGTFSLTLVTHDQVTLIDNLPTLAITSNYGCKTVIWNGSSWSIIGSV